MNRPLRPLPLLLLPLLLPLTGCTKFDLLNAFVPTCGYVRTTDLPYGPLPRQKLDIYRPTPVRSTPVRPTSVTTGSRVVIFFYGGDWQSGSKGDYRFVAQALASRGFVAVLPDYRLYPEVTFPAFVEDGALAIRWAHDHASDFGGDPDHLYLMGHSAGAHIAALLTLDAHYLKSVGLDMTAIRATAALSGPYDFIPSADELGVFSLKPGETPPDAMEPIHFADGRAPPMLLVNGLQDTVVVPGNARLLADRIRANGGEVKVIIYKNLGHVGVVLSLAYPFRWLAPVLRNTTAFFREH